MTTKNDKNSKKNVVIKSEKNTKNIKSKYLSHIYIAQPNIDCTTLHNISVM